MTPYLGEIRIFAGVFAPQNWMLCNGAELQINEYQALYALLGTTWGGNGITTFKIPNLASRLPVGQGQGPGITAKTLGAMAGSDSATLDVTTLPPHGHTLMASSALATSVSPGATLTFAQVQAGDVFYANDQATVQALDQTALSPSGGSQPHENRMPAMALNYIICVQNGLFPVRP